MRRPPIASLLILCCAGCELFGSKPAPEEDAGVGPGPDAGRASTDGGPSDAGTLALGPRRARLGGPWPQATRDESAEARTVARGYRVDARAAAGSAFTAVACGERCQGTCGIALEAAANRTIADAQVVTGPAGSVYVHVLETGAGGLSSRIARASANDDTLRGEQPLDVDLPAVFAAITGQAPPPADTLRLVVREMFVVGHSPGSPSGPDTAHALVLFGHVFHEEGATWSVRDAFIAVDPPSARLLFVASLPAEVFSVTVPSLPMYQALGAAITRDGRLLALRDGRVEERGRIFHAPVPGLQPDGTWLPEASARHVPLTPLALEGTSSMEQYGVLGFGVDDLDRIWSYGKARAPSAMCAAPTDAPELLHVRVHGPSGELIHDITDPARTVASIRTLRVERRADAEATWRVMVLGDLPRSPGCLDEQTQFTKSPERFTDDEDATDACPRRFEALCRSDASACPCRGCQGLQVVCPPPLGGDPRALLVAWTFEGSAAAPNALTLRGVRAFPLSGVTGFATNKRGRALVSGRGLAFLDLDDDRVEKAVAFTVGGWDTKGGILEARNLASLDGGWQTPLFDGEGARFAAGLRMTHATARPGSGASIDHRASEWGNIVTGRAGFDDFLESRTITRSREDFVDPLGGHAEVDRIYPLARGRLLSVAHWSGPPARETTPAPIQHRIELRLAVPSDGAPAYARGRDLGIPIDFDPPRTPICEQPDDLACGYPLGLETPYADVSAERPLEVSCVTSEPDCDAEALARAWALQATATLAASSSGRIAVACTPAGLATRMMTDAGGTTRLFATCNRFAERFQPDARRDGDLSTLGVAMVSLMWRKHLPDACTIAQAPVPLRVLLRSPLSLAHAIDELGADVAAVHAGAPVFVRMPAFFARTAEWRLLTGAATLSGGETPMNDPWARRLHPSAQLTVRPAASGAVVLSATLLGERGENLGTRTIAIGVAGASPITVNSNGDAPLAAAGMRDDRCDTGREVAVAGMNVAECTLRAAIQLVNRRGESCQGRCLPSRIAFDVPAEPVIRPGSAFDVLLFPASFVAPASRPVKITPGAGAMSGVAGLVVELDDPGAGVRLENVDVEGFDGPLVEVTRMQDLDLGGVPQDHNPALTLKDGHFAGGDGVVTNGPMLLVVGPRGVEVSGSRGWGIRARELQTHSPSAPSPIAETGAFERFRIRGNRAGGIYLGGPNPAMEDTPGMADDVYSAIADTTVESNGGPGVVVAHKCSFASVVITRNEGPGVAMTFPRGGAIPSVSVFFARGLERNAVTFNRGDGIVSDFGGVHLGSPIDVTDNAGWGVRADGLVKAGVDPPSSLPEPVRVARNGGGRMCVTVDVETRGALPVTREQPCTGGGMLGTLESASFESHLSDLVVADNQGPGVLLGTAAFVTRARVERNQGPGISRHAPNGSVGPSGVGVVLNEGVVVSGNRGHGVLSTGGRLSVPGPAEITANGGAGLYTEDRDIVLESVQRGVPGRTRIADNGTGACIQYVLEANQTDPVRRTTPCELGGVVAIDGDVRGASFDVSNNAGPGIRADTVTLSDVRICNQGTPIQAQSSMLDMVDTTCM